MVADGGFVLGLLGGSPGRYFASNELKVILGYIIVNYDLKLGGNGSRPADMHVATGVMPAPDGRVVFKKREGSF